MSDRTPDFPSIAGQENIPDGDRQRIAEAAWRQSHGSIAAFQRLCVEHVRGDIDLFAEDQTALRAKSPPDDVLGPGDRRLTATGGEVGGPIAGPAGKSPETIEPKPPQREPKPAEAVAVGAVENAGTVTG